jgi:hypothetical protein
MRFFDSQTDVAGTVTAWCRGRGCRRWRGRGVGRVTTYTEPQEKVGEHQARPLLNSSHKSR